ncbi:MAG: type II toxin-antitoxin system RelE/ParE family toxin, partial [Solirubrobacterales bacterium]|nr:type II toxin-antitoxin system RelE/ParE family toxin [Solirubrobacterales bacterium]
MAYLDRIEACCLGLGDFPERGTRRDDLWPSLRTMGFERRITIAFTVAAEAVTVLRVLYGGRDLEAAFED